MKTKQVLIMCCLLLFGQQAFSQAELAIGIKAGPNFATIDTESSAAANYKNRAGFHGGAFVLVKAAKFGIQPEIIFSQQGSKVEINSQNFESNFSYVNIPVIIKLYTIAGINIQAGPQFGFVTNAEQPIQDQLNPGSYRVQDVKDKMKSSDFTVALGLGWDLPFGLTIDARYNMGLSKIYDDAPSQQTEDAKNQVFQVSLGYKLIKLGK
ncbi:MAG TPA: porin family protein [Chryseosolibacter sp.]|nr:porin family protein [Chryseosolibacter sp.]